MTKTTPLLHLDWIQAQIKWCNKYEPVWNRIYEVKRLSFGTRHFKVVEEIYISGKRIATVTSKPHSGILDPDAMLVKFDNWICYTTNMRGYIKDFFALNKIDFVSFSRLDFCIDFNVFDNGMQPEKFIKKYIYRKFLRLGKTPQVSHHFGQGKFEHYEKGLKFGSNESEVTAYIYNKTREMKSKVWKPYIYQSWINGGLNIDIDVWRVEISIKSGGVLVVSEETGEVDMFLSMKVIEFEYIYRSFFILYERYFSFVWNDGQVRKDRMRPLKLFNYKSSNEVLVRAEGMKDADRSKKIFIKKLNELNNEMRGQDFFMSIYMTAFKDALIEESSLQSWAMWQGINVANEVKKM